MCNPHVPTLSLPNISFFDFDKCFGKYEYQIERISKIESILVKFLFAMLEIKRKKILKIQVKYKSTNIMIDLLFTSINETFLFEIKKQEYNKYKVFHNTNLIGVIEINE